MAFAIIIVNLCIIACIYVWGRRLGGAYRDSICDPLTYSLAFCLIAQANLAAIAFQKTVDLRGHFYIQDDAIIWASLAYTLCQATLVALVISVGAKIMPPVNGNRSSQFEMRSNAAINGIVICYAVTLGLAIVVQIASTGLSGYLDLLSNRAYLARENKPLVVVFEVQFAIVALFYSTRHSKAYVCLCTAGFLVGTIFSGGRGTMSAILINLALYVLRFYRIRIPTLVLLCALPLGFVAMLYVGYAFRESDETVSFDQFLNQNDGLVSYFSRGEQTAVGQPLTLILSNIGGEIYPFQGLLAGMAYPIPREVFADKPVGPSSSFTEGLDEGSWALQKSEVTVSGLGDFAGEFGVVAGSIMYGGMLFFMSCAFYWAYRQRGVGGMYWPGILLACHTTLLRTDSYHCICLLWIGAVVYGLFAALSAVTFRTGSFSRRTREIAAE